MNILGRIYTMLHGFFDAVGDNETSLVSTKNDPPKHRQGVQRPSGSGWGRSMGCHSWNWVRPDREEEEIALLQGKVEGSDEYPHDPDVRYPFEALAGELRLDLRAPGDASDHGMKPVFRMFHDHVRFAVPVSAPNFGAGVPDTSICRMWAPDGMTFTQQQSDGNFVSYRASTPFSIANATPLWSAWTGKL